MHVCVCTYVCMYICICMYTYKHTLIVGRLPPPYAAYNSSINPREKPLCAPKGRRAATWSGLRVSRPDESIYVCVCVCVCVCKCVCVCVYVRV